MRITFEAIYMELANLLSKRSTCSRLSVGAVIVSSDFRYVYGLGYNGNAIGLKNECDDRDKEGCCGCLHAEANAIVNNNADRDKPKLLFITTLPCVACAKLILNLGNVKTVYYKDNYRDESAKRILTMQGIEVKKI